MRGSIRYVMSDRAARARILLAAIPGVVLGLLAILLSLGVL